MRWCFLLRTFYLLHIWWETFDATFAEQYQRLNLFWQHYPKELQNFVCNNICSDIVPLRSSLLDPTSSTPQTSCGLSSWTPQLAGGGRGLTTSSRVSLPLGICLEFYSLTLTHLTPLVKANDATYPLTPLKRKLMSFHLLMISGLPYLLNTAISKKSERNLTVNVAFFQKR